MRLTWEYRPSYGWLTWNLAPKRAFRLFEQRTDCAEVLGGELVALGGLPRQMMESIHCPSESSKAVMRRPNMHARAVSCIS